MVETVIVVKIRFLTLKIGSRGWFVDAPYVPAGRLGIEDMFKFSVVIEPRHSIIVIDEARF